MTTMTRPCVLLWCLVIGLRTRVHSQRLVPLKDGFEITTEVVIPCGSRCLVKSYREVLESASKCVMAKTGVIMEVTQYLTDNNLSDEPTYQQIYDAIFREGRSPICRWYRTYGGCFEIEFGRICDRGVTEGLTSLIEDFDMLICSQNPNYLACLAHPSLIDDPSQTNNSPYVRCLTNLLPAFQNFDYDNFYEELIIKDNGATLFRTLSTFGNCIGDAVKTVTVSPPTGCAVVGEDIKKYINDGLDYFHFGQGGKDHLKCFAKSALHMDWAECASGFEADLRTNFGDSFLGRLNTTLFTGGYSALQRPYSRLSNCFKTALNNNCGREPDSVALVTRILHPLDHLYGVRSDNPAFCSGPRTSVASLALILCGLLTFLCGLL